MPSVGRFWKWSYFRRHLWPGCQDGWMKENGPDGFPSLLTTYILKMVQIDFLHNIFLASPCCPNVIPGKQIVKKWNTM